MKSIVTLIAGLVAVSAFAAEPAKKEEAKPVAPAATVAPAKAEEKKPEMKLAKKKEEAKPADATKSQAPAAKEPAKAAEPAKK